MAPAERKKPPRLQKQSYSLDNPPEEKSDGLYRTASVTLVHDDSVKQAGGPAWLRRSRDKLGETPEYLIRTGSMKSKRIEDTDRDTEHATLAVPSNYTSYVVQAGCYMWTGRSYHRDSYIVHRREKRGESKKEETEGRVVSTRNSDGRADTRKDNEEKEVAKRDTDTTESDTNEQLVKCYDKPALPVLDNMARSYLYSGHKNRVESGKIKEKCEDAEKDINDIMRHKVSDLNKLNDDIVRNVKDEKHKNIHKKLHERKTQNGLETMGSLNKAWDIQGNQDKGNWNTEEFEHSKQLCTYQSNSLPPHPRKTLLELMKRMREQIKTLLEQQLEVDYKIVTNEVFARDIAAKLSILVGDKEVAKFNLHVKELESVHNLILGLAARLAKVEENIEMLKHYNSETDSELILLVRKKDKLVEQLAEAQGIRDNIDRRSKKVRNNSSFIFVCLSFIFRLRDLLRNISELWFYKISKNSFIKRRNLLLIGRS
jgi:hypothetical protein